MGLVQRSYVEAVHEDGNRQRLMCTIRHEGPVNIADPDGARGLVAVSQIHTLSCAIDRMNMVVRRTRRAGAMAAAMSALTMKLCKPEDVGKRRTNEVFLLEPHTRIIGHGVTARCIASSWNLHDHPYHYLNPFEAPSPIALDAFQQSCHLTALRENKLIKPGERLHALASSSSSSSSSLSGTPISRALPSPNGLRGLRIWLVLSCFFWFLLLFS